MFEFEGVSNATQHRCKSRTAPLIAWIKFFRWGYRVNFIPALCNKQQEAFLSQIESASASVRFDVRLPFELFEEDGFCCHENVANNSDSHDILRHVNVQLIS